jgi:cysteine desulfurase
MLQAMDSPVYFDHNATTRVVPEVISAMLPFLEQRWGNPSSAYSFGHGLSEAIDEARGHIADLIHAHPREIIFTSCGTESNNTAIHSALVVQPGKKHIVTSAVEHAATLKFCKALAEQGHEVTFLPVTPQGELDPDRLRAVLRPDTAVVSVMWANNETGMLFPIPELAAICHERGVLLHTDAVQMAGKMPIDVEAAGVDMLSLSAHKLNAPKGIGALYVRRKTPFRPYLIGGSQERGRRGGTENVPYMVGFGVAARLAGERLEEKSARVRLLRDQLEQGLLGQVPGAQRNGAAEPRLPNTTNLAFPGVEAEGVLMLLDQAGICASSGSACTTGSLQPSHVLTAMGIDAARARSSLRLSLGGSSTEEEVGYVLKTLPEVIARLRLHVPMAGEWAKLRAS